MNKLIELIEDNFLEGNIAELKNKLCPICEKGKLKFYIAKVQDTGKGEPGRRYKSGITIYCIGKCDSMISHLDGFCPAWAENIEDWDKFNRELYCPL